MRPILLVVALLPLMACTNVSGHAWSGGGTHYSSGTMYTGPIDTSSADTGDTSGDTAPVDTGSNPGTGMTAISASCAFTDDPNIGIVLECNSTWSETDAAALDGGTLTFNLMDVDHVSKKTADLPISQTADGGEQATLDGTTITFQLQGLDETKSFYVAFYLTAADGVSSSAEEEFAVSPL